MRLSRPTSPRVIFGVASLLGIYSAFQAFQYVAFFAEKPTSIWLLLGLNLSYWYAWAVLAPIVLWLSNRFPFERDIWWRSLLVHLVGVLVITFTHIAIYEAVRVALISRFWPEPMKDTATWSWWSQVSRYYFMNFDWEMMTYW